MFKLRLQDVWPVTIIYDPALGAIMVSKRREEENRAILESEKAMSDMTVDDRTDRVCPRCAIATSLRRCPKCGSDTLPME